MFMLGGETFELSEKTEKREKTKTTELISPSCRGEQAEERVPNVWSQPWRKKRHGEIDSDKQGMVDQL